MPVSGILINKVKHLTLSENNNTKKNISWNFYFNFNFNGLSLNISVYSFLEATPHI